MQYDRDAQMMAERDMEIDRKMAMREPLIIENPEHLDERRSIDVYEKREPRASRFDEPLRPALLDKDKFERKSDYPHPNRNSALRSRKKYRSPTGRETSIEQLPLREGSSLRRKRSLSREYPESLGTAAVLVEEKFYENIMREGGERDEYHRDVRPRSNLRDDRSNSSSLRSRKRSSSPYSKSHFVQQMDKESRRQSIMSKHQAS